ncbi:hypothetical protein KCU90_g3849, partial [Aureobasidium melanogenum]
MTAPTIDAGATFATTVDVTAMNVHENSTTMASTTQNALTDPIRHICNARETPAALPIHRHAGEPQTERPHRQQQATLHQADFPQTQMEAACGHGRHPAPKAESNHRVGDGEQGQRQKYRPIRDKIAADARQTATRIRGCFFLPPRLLRKKNEQTHGQPDHADQEQRDLPRRDRTDEGNRADTGGLDCTQQRTTQYERQPGSEHQRHRVHGQCTRPALFVDPVAKQRIGRRWDQRFRAAHNDSRHEERHERRRDCVGSHGKRPDRHAHRNHNAPVEPVRQPAGGQPYRNIGNRKCRADQKADLDVARPEVPLNRPHHQHENVLVDLGQHAHHSQAGNQPPLPQD